MTKKTNNLLPIGARVRVELRAEPGMLTGRVLGYGFEQDLRAGSQLTTVPVYLVHLDEGFWGEGSALFISVIVANPDNVKEAESERK